MWQNYSEINSISTTKAELFNTAYKGVQMFNLTQIGLKHNNFQRTASTTVQGVP